MAVTFRKSVLGYNKEDVMNYLNELYDKINRLEERYRSEAEEKDNALSELKKQLADISESLNTANAELTKLIVENDGMKAELEVFRSEKEKQERLGEVIGKMYLVSKLNAETITRSAKNMKRRLEDEINSDLNAVEEAQKKLNAISDSVTENSESFKITIEKAQNSLDEAKAMIDGNKKIISRSETELNRILDAANMKN